MFLSFIVPVYNVEQYLDECLQSLLDQDIPLTDYEIICINDGSTDGSLDILERYKNEYSNIRVITKVNGGLAAARNTGLEYASGEYVWFIDSDDFIQKNILRTLQGIVEYSGCDRLSVEVYTFFDELSDAEKSEQGSLTSNTYLYNIAVWNNLFRLDFLKRNNLHFHPELRYAEDSIFMFEFCLTTNIEKKTNQVCYYYRRRPQSLTSGTSVKALENKITGSSKVALYYNEYYKQGIGEPRYLADQLMGNLWQALFSISQLPGSMRFSGLMELRKEGLFPFRRPNACTLKKSYQTTRTDLVGKIFDKVYINMHRPWGFAAMVLLQKLIAVKKKLVK